MRSMRQSIVSGTVPDATNGREITVLYFIDHKIMELATARYWIYYSVCLPPQALRAMSIAGKMVHSLVADTTRPAAPLSCSPRPDMNCFARLLTAAPRFQRRLRMTPVQRFLPHNVRFSRIKNIRIDPFQTPPRPAMPHLSYLGLVRLLWSGFLRHYFAFRAGDPYFV